MESKYFETTEWLFEQFPAYQVIGSKAYKPTLENISQILDWLGNPQYDLRFIHVAGSNGKGSVCSMIASTLTEANYKVGLFTSPHLKDFSERIRIDGETIEQEFVIDFVERLKSYSFSFAPSFFEITFALALVYFKKAKCDYCVIETGLGGRLDATNIISPLLSVITSISLEHTNILGDTIEEIATEKGGIIKDDTPVILNPTNKVASTTLNAIAESRSASVLENNTEIPIEIKNKLLAEYQVENMITALTAIDFIDKSLDLNVIIKGFENIYNNTGYRARLQIVNNNPLTIFDVSHNPAGIESTIEAIIRKTKGELNIIYGTSSDKDLKSILDVLPNQANYYITEFNNNRSAKLETLREHFSGSNLKSTRYFDLPESALKSAKLESKESDTILVIGSFFLLEHFF